MSTRFEITVEYLLDEKVICEASYPEAFRFLQDSRNRSEVNAFLHRVSRQVGKTKDSKGYYCSYETLEDPKRRKKATKQFSHMLADLEPLIDWLRLVRNVDAESRPIEAGTRISESELLSAIEESSSMSELLSQIASKFRKVSRSVETKTKLRSVLTYLSDNGYLLSVGSSGAVYIATAKWSLLFDQLEFIHSFEGYELPDDEPESQQELF
ncbi:hypothetical protein WFH67_14465 [Vibrio vulnificus]|uniref:hypothetical protein n=1 Tax=Vibrio TaxID=662 RepID=UPI001E071024|nr:hypothetical protein [Vibrio vulnificus]